MLKIQKQIGYLYTSSILESLTLTGAWVAILSSRGFSLVGYWRMYLVESEC